MELVITPAGVVRAIYGEEIPLETLGPPRIARASVVEPTSQGQWLVDLAPVGGPQLGPYAHRSDALRAEVEWLRRRWLFT
jgi:hypothetical protein